VTITSKSILSAGTATAVAMAAALATTATRPGVAPTPDAVAPPAQDRVVAALDATAIPFVRNDGQDDGRVAFSARTFAGTTWVTRDGALVHGLPGLEGGAWSLVERFEDGRVDAAGVEPATTRVSNFTAGRLAGAAPTFAAVSLGRVWNGIDVSLRAHGRNVEKIYVVAPGASPGAIRMRVSGASELHVDRAGRLVASTGLGPVTFAAPIAFQQIDGRRVAIPVAYDVRGNAYGFALGDYDRALPLVIDPVIQSTYLGSSTTGTSLNEAVNAIAVNPANGEVYVAGGALGATFPGTTGGAQAAYGGGSQDAYVARLSADLRTLVQATFLGGSSTDEALGMTLTSSSVYIAGLTASTNFPTTSGARQPTDPSTSGLDGFVARLPLSLTSVTAATYVGGGTNVPLNTPSTQLNDLVVSASGAVIACGQTRAELLPQLPAGSIQVGGSGSTMLLVALSADLASFGAVAGFGDNLQCRSLARATGGSIYAAGTAGSPATLPNTAGGALPNTGGTTRGWVARFNELTLAQIAPASWAVGAGTATTVKVHPLNGDVYVLGSGHETSSAFPPNATSTGAQTTCNGSFDCAFVFRFAPSLASVVGGTFYGNPATASAIPRGHDHIVIDPTGGDVYVGLDAGTGMPGTTGSFQSSVPTGASTPSVVARLSADLATLRRAAYVTGTNGDARVLTLALTTDGTDLYVAGRATSTTLPQTAGGARPTNAGGEDAFVMRVGADLAAGGPPGTLQFSVASSDIGEAGGPVQIDVSRVGGSSGPVSVQYATANGSATSGADYTATSGTLSWSDGETTPKRILVDIANDTVVEPTETFTVTLTAPTGGATLGAPATTTVNIVDNDVAPPPAPVLSSSATALAFASRDVGTTSAGQSVTFTNSGNAALTFGTIAKGGAHAGDFAVAADGCSGQAVAAAATCSVQVTFTPTAAGARSATLTVPTNAAGSPATITLSGDATTPAPPPSQGGGGGGSVDRWTLLLLASLLALRTRRRPARA
jgi:hypothetical protein